MATQGQRLVLSAQNRMLFGSDHYGTGSAAGAATKQVVPAKAPRIPPILLEVVRNSERDRPQTIRYRIEMFTSHPRTASGLVPHRTGRTTRL